MDRMQEILTTWGIRIGEIVGALLFLKWALGIVIIGPKEIGIIEKRWSKDGSVKEGHIIALNNEAGYQPGVLRTGLHFLTPLFYLVHKEPLITIGRGKIGYIFSRDGEPLKPTQTLGRIIEGGFEDCARFLANGGQRGPNRSILREGTYAINTACFAVLTESGAHYIPMGNDDVIDKMQQDLMQQKAFDPVIIPGDSDQCGIVTVQDGPPLKGDAIIAPTIEADHQGFQDPETFIIGGGMRGRQLQVLVEGTYFINRIFATVELIRKTLVEVGNVGVIVSYVGEKGTDQSGPDFSHGELVESTRRGVLKDPLGPGKYALNLYALQCYNVPTTNVVLKWKDNEAGEHGFDAQLTEIEMITKDGYDLRLPLSVVCHIDYTKAPSVIQRFGDVSKLVNQTLDPFVSAYFKNVGQSKDAIQLLNERTKVQEEATKEMKSRFAEYDLVLVDVLISTPHGIPGPDGEDKFQTLLEQLRLRKLAQEKVQTYEQQQSAAEQEKKLNEALATAGMQKDVTEARIAIEIATSRGSANLATQEMNAKARIAIAEGDKQAEILNADGKKQAVILEAEGQAKSTLLNGEANANATAKVGVAEGIAIRQKVDAYGGPEFEVFIKSVALIAHALETGKQPLVPLTQFTMGNSGNETSSSASTTIEGLLNVISIEKLQGIAKTAVETNPEIAGYVKKIMENLMDSINTNPSAEASTEPTTEETLAATSVEATDTPVTTKVNEHEPQPIKTIPETVLEPQ